MKFTYLIALSAITAFLVSACEVSVGAPNGGGITADNSPTPAAIAAAASAAGGSGSSTAPFNLQLTWPASKEPAVNRVGGGYKVYYSTTVGVPAGSGSVQDVPFNAMTGTTPNTVIIPNLTNHAPGGYYVKISAYSSIPKPGGGTAISAPSNERFIAGAP